MTKKTVLFLCTGNSARSQMAEALLRYRAGSKYDVYSAGTSPEAIDARAEQVIKDFGIDVSELKSKNLSEFSEQVFDYVITLCDKATAECRDYPGAVKQLAWDFPDPKLRQGNHPFSATLNELNNRLSMFLLVEEKASNHSSELAQKDDGSFDILPTEFYKTLTDDIRLKTLMLTHYHGELCVCELMASLNEDSQPKVSRNLAVLKKSKVIVDRKHGQWVFYRINPDLPLWAKFVIAQTTESNADLITDEIERLAKMQGRPERASFCK